MHSESMDERARRIIAERYGFQPEKVEVITSSWGYGGLVGAAFRVCGRGYSFHRDMFGTNPAYDE